MLTASMDNDKSNEEEEKLEVWKEKKITMAMPMIQCNEFIDNDSNINNETGVITTVNYIDSDDNERTILMIKRTQIAVMMMKQQ